MRDREVAELAWGRTQGDTLSLRLGGSWTMNANLPSLADIEGPLQSSPVARRIIFDSAGLQAWDSMMLTFLLRLHELCAERRIEVDRAGLPEGVQRLLTLAEAVPERHDAARDASGATFLSRIGIGTLEAVREVPVFFGFLGETAEAFFKLVQGKARFRPVEFFLIVQQCGAQALPIVTLISFLVGLILAFVGALQLRQFGVQIYVANLVGLGMAREMGAMMTAVIMAGRTGAAFAAQLGTMKVNQEIDALQTTGLSPVEFLVMPRMLALMLMVPLLCIYANLLGILGGALVSVTTFDVTLLQYYEQTRTGVTLRDFTTGLIKGAVFGVLVALAGCFRGMKSGRSAAAVGEAATSAVVTAIVWIIVADAILTVIYNALGV